MLVSVSPAMQIGLIVEVLVVELVNEVCLPLKEFS